MCLDRIDKERGPLEGKGWKVFRDNGDGHLRNETKGNGEPLPRGRWINERDFRCAPDRETIGLREYPTGWHIFETKAEARRWATDTLGRDRIIRVEFREAVAWGTQVYWGDTLSLRVIVAKEIRIPREKRS